MSGIIASVRNAVNNLKPINWDPEGPRVKGIALIPVVSNVFLHLTTRQLKLDARAEFKGKTTEENQTNIRKYADIYERASTLAESMSTYFLIQAAAIIAYAIFFPVSNKTYDFLRLFVIITFGHQIVRTKYMNDLAHEAKHLADIISPPVAPAGSDSSSDKKDSLTTSAPSAPARF